MSVTSPFTFFLITAFFLIAASSVTGQCFSDELSITVDPESEKCDLFEPTADEIIEKNVLAASLGVVEVDTLQKELCEEGDCNISLCFALDGSGSVSSTEFQVQKDLVKLIASVAAPGKASFSAVQYGLSNTFISANTQNLSEFTDSVQKSELMKAKRTFLSAGLGFCISQLESQPQGAGRKIVVLGDGRANFAENSLSIVLGAAKKIDIYAVGIGFPKDSKRLLELAGNRKDRVFGISRYSNIVDVVFKLARSLCNIKPKATVTA